MAGHFLVAERHALLDPCHVDGLNHRRVTQMPTALRVLRSKQMAASRMRAQHFSGGGDLESLGHCLPGPYTFGASHKSYS